MTTPHSATPTAPTCPNCEAGYGGPAGCWMCNPARPTPTRSGETPDDRRFLLDVAEHFWNLARDVREGPAMEPGTAELIAETHSRRGNRARDLAATFAPAAALPLDPEGERGDVASPPVSGARGDVEALEGLLEYCEKSELYCEGEAVRDSAAAAQWRRRAKALREVLSAPAGSDADGLRALYAAACNDHAAWDALRVGPNYSMAEWLAVVDFALLNRPDAMQALAARPAVQPTAEGERAEQAANQAADNFDMMVKTWGEEQRVSDALHAALRRIVEDEFPQRYGEEYREQVDRLKQIARAAIDAARQSPAPAARTCPLCADGIPVVQGQHIYTERLPLGAKRETITKPCSAAPAARTEETSE